MSMTAASMSKMNIVDKDLAARMDRGKLPVLSFVYLLTYHKSCHRTPRSGVGGRESSQCQARTGNLNCGDSLNFCGALNVSVYHASLMGTYGNSSSLWASTAASRLNQWGFNTLGGWSSDEACTVAGRERGLLCAKLLDIGTTWLNHDGFDNDMYSPAWPAQAKAVAEKVVAPRSNDPMLLGWQLDNEPKWETLALTPYL